LTADVVAVVAVVVLEVQGCGRSPS
jgi:hypothetical protein